MGENGLIQDSEKLTITSVNDTIGYLATFFKWTTQNGYTAVNFFEGGHDFIKAARDIFKDYKQWKNSSNNQPTIT